MYTLFYVFVNVYLFFELLFEIMLDSNLILWISVYPVCPIDKIFLVSLSTSHIEQTLKSYRNIITSVQNDPPAIDQSRLWSFLYVKVALLVFIQELGTDVNLYALVFGESVLNDAVNLNTF